jgi:hypothetical protein
MGAAQRLRRDAGLAMIRHRDLSTPAGCLRGIGAFGPLVEVQEAAPPAKIGHPAVVQLNNCARIAPCTPFSVTCVPSVSAIPVPLARSSSDATSAVPPA